MTSTTSNPEPLRVENSLDLLIALLYSPGEAGDPGEPINGNTRLQKLVFLLKQGEGPDVIVRAAKEFKYTPYKMGPFSKGLYRDLDLLNSLGMLRTTKLEYRISDDRDPDVIEEDEELVGQPEERVIESIRYELTNLGKKAGKDLLDGLAIRERKALAEFKKFFNSIPLRQLLIFVYRKYPQYTIESEIRGKLGI